MAIIDKVRVNGVDYSITASVDASNVNYDSLEAYDEGSIGKAVQEKLDALISGINIKTINNNSIIGEGNINIGSEAGSITDVLVNGESVVDSAGVANTKIKTVNGNSLVGDGDIIIESGSGSSVTDFSLTREESSIMLSISQSGSNVKNPITVTIPSATKTAAGILSSAVVSDITDMESRITTLEGTIIVNQSGTVYFESVEAMIESASALSSGMLVMTKGFYEANDGGGSTYIIKSALPSGATADGASCVSLGNSLYADIVIPANETFNFRQFGARPWTSSVQEDEKEYMDNFKAFCVRYGKVFNLYIPQGYWAFSPTWMTVTLGTGQCGLKVSGEQSPMGGMTYIAPVGNQDYIWRVGGNEAGDDNTDAKRTSFNTSTFSADMRNLAFTTCAFDSSTGSATTYFYKLSTKTGYYSEYSYFVTAAMECRLIKNCNFDNIFFKRCYGSGFVVKNACETRWGKIYHFESGTIIKDVIYSPFVFAKDPYTKCAGASANYFDYLYFEDCSGHCFDAKSGCEMTHCEMNDVQVEWSPAGRMLSADEFTAYNAAVDAGTESSFTWSYNYSSSRPSADDDDWKDWKPLGVLHGALGKLNINTITASNKGVNFSMTYTNDSGESVTDKYCAGGLVVGTDVDTNDGADFNVTVGKFITYGSNGGKAFPCFYSNNTNGSKITICQPIQANTNQIYFNGGGAVGYPCVSVIPSCDMVTYPHLDFWRMLANVGGFMYDKDAPSDLHLVMNVANRTLNMRYRDGVSYKVCMKPINSANGTIKVSGTLADGTSLGTKTLTMAGTQGEYSIADINLASIGFKDGSIISFTTTADCYLAYIEER